MNSLAKLASGTATDGLDYGGGSDGTDPFGDRKIGEDEVVGTGYRHSFSRRRSRSTSSLRRRIPPKPNLEHCRCNFKRERKSITLEKP